MNRTTDFLLVVRAVRDSREHLSHAKNCLRARLRSNNLLHFSFFSTFQG